MAKSEAANLEVDILANRMEEEMAGEMKVVTQKTVAEGRAEDRAAIDSRRRGSTLAVAGGDEEAKLEARIPTLHLRRATCLSTPEPEERFDTHPAKRTPSTNGSPPIPLVTIFKKSQLTNTTGTSASTCPSLNSISISSILTPNNKPLRTVTFHPTATVQDTEVPYSYPRRAEKRISRLELL